MDVSSDAELIERLKAGDVDAFSLLDAKWRPILYGLFSRKGIRREDAEDLVQVTLLRVWKKRHLYDAELGSFCTWIWCLAEHCLVNLVRSRKHHQVGGSIHQHLVAEYKIMDEGFLGDVEHREMVSVVRTALSELPEWMQDTAEGYTSSGPGRSAARSRGVKYRVMRDRLKQTFDRLRGDSRLCELVASD